MCLADQGRGISGGSKAVPQDRNRFAEVDVVVENLVPAMAATGDHAGARRHADRIRGIRPVEPHPLVRETVHMRRPKDWVVDPDRVPALLVCGDEEEVGFSF